MNICTIYCVAQIASRASGQFPQVLYAGETLHFDLIHSYYFHTIALLNPHIIYLVAQIAGQACGQFPQVLYAGEVVNYIISILER